MDEKINLRIDQDVKLGLEELAREENQTLSVYLRTLLSDHVEQFQVDHDGIPEVVYLGIPAKKLTKGYEQTFEFTALLTWLFCRYTNPIEPASKEALKGIKSKVESVINSSGFSQELKMEFLKVLNDLNRFLLEPDYQYKQFAFSVMGNHQSFNYDRLINEIWSLEKKHEI
ncbi:hypothetical protein [Aestuariibaculum sediminum]|uniref:Uncharacterized protein n=1 Tax=Aestuariibaculum sediminum TaxID=2770637 RepID=A0A8J6QMY9_9FLAO|nr:hypothetical protein [Aestuariibaculum sediminum]MBD0833754.1 hypothetical protein [Aestuariibaculum sediminum]